MNWFNIYGFVFMVLIMIPNIVFSVKCKDGFVNYYKNKIVEMFEQIGRIGCFILMIINIPYTYFWFVNKTHFNIYLVVNSLLVLGYEIIWIVCFNKNSIFRAISLSVIPAIVFIFSGIISRYILLNVFALVFAPCHITISYKNAKLSK